MTTVTEAFQQLNTFAGTVNTRLQQLDAHVEQLYLAIKSTRNLTPEEQAAFDQVKATLQGTADLTEQTFREDGVPPTA